MKLFILFITLFLPLFTSAKELDLRPEAHFESSDGMLKVHTAKVARIRDLIDVAGYEKFAKDMIDTATLPGDRVIFINSPGGYASQGNKILKLIRKEQAHGTRVICYVEQRASSMAFNILTQCDVRVADLKAVLLAHKIYYEGDAFAADTMLNARMLRRLADTLDRDDEPFRQANAKAMNLSLSFYDIFADLDTRFSAGTLHKYGYLHYLISLPK